jgi:O-methyltransferase
MLRAFFSRFIRPVLRRIGLDIVPYPPVNAQLQDSDESTREIWEFVSPFTMTSPERVSTLIDAVRYVHENNIPGDMVECGVWRGGSSMAMAMTLKSLGSTDRQLYLYDTFEGMSDPTDADVSFRGLTAEEELKSNTKEDEFSDWCLGTIEEVTENLGKTGYPGDKITYVKGKIEETVPATIPKRIALLRLDTDWFESTKHEMEHLFPLLSTDGILILDDYGYWQGARKAVDEYIAENNVRILLNRIDFTGRIAVKSAGAQSL